MSNEFDEHLWTSEQRTLDGQITQEVEALAGSHFSAVVQGHTEHVDWARSAKPHVAIILPLVEKLEHKGRREHWYAELELLGLRPARPKEKEVPKATEETKTDGP